MINTRDLSYWQARALEAELQCNRLRIELDACRRTNKRLHKDKVEMAAMVGRVSRALAAAHGLLKGNKHYPDQPEYDQIIGALAETPPTALQHLKADTLEHEADLMESAEQLSANGAFDMRQVAMRLRERARQYRDGEIE